MCSSLWHRPERRCRLRKVARCVAHGEDSESAGTEKHGGSFALTASAASAKGTARSGTAARTAGTSDQDEAAKAIWEEVQERVRERIWKGQGQVRFPFNQIMKMGWNYAFSLFHDSNRSSPICFKFQDHTCQDPSSCNMRHVCIGCATEGKPYNDCHCLQSKLN